MPDLKKHTFTFVGVLILAAIVASFGFYVFKYKSNRESYFTDSRRRQLGIVAEQIEGAVDSRRSSLRNAVTAFVANGRVGEAVCLAPLQMQLRLAGFGEAQCGPGAEVPAETTAVNVKPIKGVVLRETASLDYDSDTSHVAPTQKRNARLRFCYQPKSAGSVQSYDGHAPLATAVCEVEGCCADGAPCGERALCAKVTLADLVSPFLAGDGFGSGNVFISQGTRILFESGTNDLWIGTLLESAARAEGKGGDAKAPSGPPPVATFPSPAELAAFSVVREVEIAGRNYRLFTHPLRLSGNDQTATLGFLIESSRFEKEVASLSLGALSYVPLLIGIALLAVKLLKLRTMGARERLTAGDVRMLAFSLLALAGTLTTLALAAYEYHRLGAALNQELENVAERIGKNLNAELAAARSALSTYATQALARATDPTRFEPATGIFDLCTRDGSSGPYSCESRCSGRGCPAVETLALLRQQYPFFEMATRSDSEGQQLEKWSTGSTATALIRSESVSSGDVRRGRLRPGSPALAMHLRLSTNTGGLIPVLSTPILGGDQAAGGGRPLLGSAALIPELASLQHPVLPAGFRFAIIERGGKVVAHSVPSRSLYENFFEECDVAGSLRSLIESRGRGGFSGHYRGRAQRFYVEPIEGSPWTLVVFRDREVPRTILLDALLTWFAVYGAYLGIALLGVTILRFAVSHRGGEWLWPDGHRADAYLTCLMALLFATLLFLAAIIHRPLSSLAMLGQSIALPLAASVHVYLCIGGTSVQNAKRIAALALFAVAAIVALLTAGGNGVAISVAVGAVAILGLLSEPESSVLGREWWTWAGLALGAVLIAGWASQEQRHVAEALAILIAAGAVFLAIDRSRPSPKVDFKQTYAWAGVAFVVVVGVLPAAAFFEDAWDESLEVFVRHGQLKTAAALDERRTRIADEYAARALALPNGPESQKRRDGMVALRDDRLTKTWDIVTSSFFGTEQTQCPAPDQEPGKLADRFWRIGERHFSGIVSSQLLVYHDESIEIRELLDTVAGDRRWRWRHELGEPNAVLCWTRHNPGGDTSDAALAVAWPPADLEQGSTALSWVLAVVLGILLVGWYFLVRWIMRSVFGAGEWLITSKPQAGEPHFGNGVLLLRRAGMTEDWSARKSDPELGIVWDKDVHVLDLRTRPAGWDVRDSIPPAAKVVLIKHLEQRLENLPTLDATLNLLEAVLFRQKRTKGDEYLVIVVSAVQPLAYLRRRLQSSFDVAADKFIQPEVIGRWARFLECLDRVDADQASPGKDDPASGTTPTERVESLSLVELVAWLVAIRAEDLYRAYHQADFGPYAKNTTQTPRLRGIAWEILWQRQISHWRTGKKVSPRQVAKLRRDAPGALAAAHSLASLQEDNDDPAKAEHQLTDATRAHYRALWSQLTDDEQLTLVQLAREGYVNPRGWRLVNDLMARGLVVFTPAPRLMNETFRQFAASEETDVQVRRWETADGRSGWDKTRNIILFLVIGGGLVLYLTQPEKLGQMVGVIASLGAATATVANLFGLLGGRPAASPPPAKP